MTEAVAALDCGSNSTRLLIVNGANETLRREMRITRLSQGVDASGTLVPEAMQRTFDVLSEYRAFMDDSRRRRADCSWRPRPCATPTTARSSWPRPLDAPASRCGSSTAYEEATYSYVGATTGLPADERTTVIVDVGGGSTELAIKVDGVLESYSMQLGCVRVTERALGKGVVSVESDAAARAMIDAELDRAWAAVPDFARLVGHVRLVGLAGSVSTLAQLDAGLARYDRDAVHHRRISLATVERWRDRLSS